MREEQERLKKLLHETVSMLCRNGLAYERCLRVEGVIGITVDDDDVFLVHINDTVGTAQEAAPHHAEYSQNFVKAEPGLTATSGSGRLEPVMPDYQSALMPYRNPLYAASAGGNEHISSTVVTESIEIKPNDMMGSGVWGGSYEESYSDPAYPPMDMMSGFSYQRRPVGGHRGRPRGMVCSV